MERERDKEIERDRERDEEREMERAIWKERDGKIDMERDRYGGRKRLRDHGKGRKITEKGMFCQLYKHHQYISNIIRRGTCILLNICWKEKENNK